MSFVSKLSELPHSTLLGIGGVGFLATAVTLSALRRLMGDIGDQNIASLMNVFLRYRGVDFVSFMRSHREAYKRGTETGDFVPGVCNYYNLMSDLITMTSGPYWHFVPMYRGLTRRQCHEKYHHLLTQYLEAKAEEKVLELGCGFGEMGRQVALISGARVTGLTMADAEIVGGNERIKAAGLEGRCQMVQGNYHNMPFESGSFDKVFGVYTLKYSADLDKAFSEAARVLKPGGKFVSYEILVTDKYDPTEKKQRCYVTNISSSTCMPPLWHASDFRESAKKAGLVPCEEEDLCAPEGVGQWYSCFERTGVFQLLNCGMLFPLIKMAEVLRILPRSFTDWFEHCLYHPTTDFVLSGRAGIVTGSVMMTWKKP